MIKRSGVGRRASRRDGSREGNESVSDGGEKLLGAEMIFDLGAFGFVFHI